MSKYFPLSEYLLKSEATRIELTFDEIEKILGFKLPQSAYSYAAWWANKGHNHALTWTNVGYSVDNINFSIDTVSFLKTTSVISTKSKSDVTIKKKDIENVKPIAYQSNISDINVQGYQFRYLQKIMPDCDKNGKIIKYFPHEKYDNENNLPLLKQGQGPFCHFTIDTSNCAGVYLWIVDKEIVYIGETEDLRRRFNTGYGSISPRNCYKGGQSTNCKMNKLVLDLFEQGKIIDLYFYETKHYKEVEKELLKRINTLYNVKDNR